MLISRYHGSIRLIVYHFLIFTWMAIHGQSTEQSVRSGDLDSDGSPTVSARIQGDELQVIYNIPEGQHQVIQDDYNFMTINTDSVHGIRFGKTIYPDGDKDKEGNTVYHGIVILKKKWMILEPLAALPDSIRILTGYQFCTAEGMCFAPNSVYLTIPFDHSSIKALPPEQPGTSKDSRSVLWMNLLFAFLGGLILNIMPCVLPVLSIKIMSLVGSAHHDRQEILKGSMSYTAGVLFSFLILGTVVAGLKMAGQGVGWGFQFQSIGFVVFLLAIVWIFGLSLFDVFTIQLPGMQLAAKAKNYSGHLGSFLTGIVAVLLATPCTAPMLGVALGWTFTQPPILIMLSFIIIGFGLAFPFFLIGFFPVFVRFIPKPGAWMNTFKDIMAFLLMATVVYLLRVSYFLVEGRTINILWFLLMAALACWILGKYSIPSRRRVTRTTAWIAALLILLGAGVYFLRFHESQENSENPGTESMFQKDSRHRNWAVFHPELLQKMLAEHKSVFIDFAAEWCLTCKANETTVLFTRDIQDAFAEKNIVLLRGDYTKKNQVIQEWLEKFNRAGVPLYVLYRSGEKDPVVFPEVITKEMILEQLNRIQSAE
jgi:thiol:disulfide interchange protein